MTKLKIRKKHIKPGEHRHGRRVPKPFEKWLAERGFISDGGWSEIDDKKPDWLDQASQVAAKYGCIIIYDSTRHWQESHYVPHVRHKKTGWKGSLIAIGGKGASNYCCTVFLHELGHHILTRRGQVPTDMVRHEEAAWQVAIEIAGAYRFPFTPNIRRQALYSYRYGALLDRASGSKAKNPKKPHSKSMTLSESRRSSGVCGSPIDNEMQKHPRGKKGKRLTKKHIKKATAKVERRKGRLLCDGM